MIKFGTSGFRGIIGDNWTKENVQKIGFAFRKVCEEKKKPVQIIVGFDNRFMGREAAQWFCEAACSDKNKTTFMNVAVPTPLVAFKATQADFGIIITASHNPYFYNGIKIFLRGGKEGDDEFFGALEKNLDTKFALTKFDKLIEKGIVVFSEETEDYIDKIASFLDAKTIKSSNRKVLFNQMHGSGAAITRRLFEKLGLPYYVINETPDPYFGGSLPAPYPHNLIDMAAKVVKDKYHFGIALDGDADRISIIDGDGKFYDCNYIAAALYYYLVQIKKQKGGAVKNFLTTSLINKLCKLYGFETHETLVGFKNMGGIFEKSNALIAAESGGMGIKSISLQKDGIATAAFLVDLVASMKKSIGEIVKEIAASVSFPSTFVEYAYPFDGADRDALLKKLLAKDKPKFLQEVTKIDEYFDGFKITFKGDYWTAARLSGNENVLRMYTEMPTEPACNEILETMEKFYNMTVRQK